MTPKIILWDIESSHNIVATFQLKQQDAYIHSDNILQERALICASWKELGIKKIHAVSRLDDPKLFKQDPHSDAHVLKVLHKVLSEADVLIAHNGDSFDWKLVKGRMLIQGLAPLPPVLSIDTLKAARNQFLLNANNLGYLAGLLGVGAKKTTKSGLWLRVLRGEANAIREMVRYNKGDVAVLERVFLKLQPYIPDHINRQLFVGGTSCPRCGSSKIQSRGVHRALTQTYLRWQCQACAGWFRTRRARPDTVATHNRVL